MEPVSTVLRVACVALALSGCARNAMLELDVVVPEQAIVDDRRYAYIEVSSGVSDFDETPFSIQGAVSVDLPEGGRTVPFAVLTGDETTEVRVLVRYCHDATCGDPDLDVRPFLDGLVPGYRYAFERAFYIGAVTSYTLDVAALGATPESTTVSNVCRCEIAGCATTLPGGSYCRGTSDVCDTDPMNTHFCE